MPGETVGIYEGELTAGTEVSSTYEGRHLTVREDELIHTFHADTFVDKGDPVVLCDAGVPTSYGKAVGVAFKNGLAASTMISIDTEGIWNLTVFADDDNGISAIEIGDELYIRAGDLPGNADLDGTGDGEISKIVDPATQVPFGYALGSMAAGATGQIAVKVHWDPSDHWLGDDEKMYFGDDQDIVVYWTDQELLFQDDRTIDVGDGYNRTIHVSSNITMTASRYSAISCYSELIGGTGGLGAYGGSFSLVQGTTKTVDAHFGAVMAEVKNSADLCSTAEALFCRWDNRSTIGFSGVMHSFIRFQDLSVAHGGSPVTTLFHLFEMDATAAAAANVIVCQAGNAIASSHVIKITANGVPYWIMMDSTPPA